MFEELGQSFITEKNVGLLYSDVMNHLRCKLSSRFFGGILPVFMAVEAHISAIKDMASCPSAECWPRTKWCNYHLLLLLLGLSLLCVSRSCSIGCVRCFVLF